MVADLIDPPPLKTTAEFTRAHRQTVDLVAGRLGLQKHPNGGWYIRDVAQLKEMQDRIVKVLEAST